MAVVNELVTKFSFQGSSKPLTNYNEALGTSIKIMASFATATLASAGAFARFVTNIAASFDPLTQLSRTTGVAIEEMQKLGFVASQNGSDLNAVTSSLESLSAKIGEAAQVGSAEFARLGISVRKANGEVKKADEVLMEVGQRFREMGLSRAEQISFAEKLGIDKSLIQTLNLSSEAMNKLKKQAEDLGVVTQKEANAMADLTDSVTVLKYGFDSIKNSIAVGFAPVLQELAESFTEFLGKNKELISEGLQKVGKWITTLAQAIVRLMPVIAGIGVAFLAFKVYTLGLSGALALLFSPVTLIIGGITALLFIVDDLIVAFRGGESVIANFFDSVFGIDIVGVLSGWGSAIANFAGILKDAFVGAFDVVKNSLMGLFDFFKSVLDGIMKGISAVTNTVSSVKSFFSFGDDEQPQIQIPELEAPNFEQLQPMQQIPNFGQPQAPQGITSNNNVNQDVKIEIKTDDPQTAGRSVQNSLNEQLRDAQYQLKRGGM
jgi:hypothetical protein